MYIYYKVHPVTGRRINVAVGVTEEQWFTLKTYSPYHKYIEYKPTRERPVDYHGLPLFIVREKEERDA